MVCPRRRMLGVSVFSPVSLLELKVEVTAGWCEELQRRPAAKHSPAATLQKFHPQLPVTTCEHCALRAE
ncbi:uncharacterized [Tachysurus ichikawai]